MKFRHYAYIILTIILLILGIGFFPVKYAVKREKLDIKRSFIFIQEQKTTVSPWKAIGDQATSYFTPLNVRINGEEPSNYNYGVEIGHNTFVCYGYYSRTGDLGGSDKYSIYEATGWNIVYPIKRDSIFGSILPKSYLCVFDMIK